MDVISEKVYANTGNDHVINLIPANARTILDVGCGSGSIAGRLKLRGIVCDGITISNQELQLAEQYLRKGFIYNLENGLPAEIPSESFDVVICSHVLEHICYPELLLKDILRVLKKDGSLIVALPNLLNYKSRFKLLAGNFEYQNAGIWDNTHFKWYTYASAQKLLIDHGFEIQFKDVTGEIPWKSVLGKILPDNFSRFFYSGLKGISRGFFGHQLLFRATKP